MNVFHSKANLVHLTTRVGKTKTSLEAYTCYCKKSFYSDENENRTCNKSVGEQKKMSVKYKIIYYTGCDAANDTSP